MDATDVEGDVVAQHGQQSGQRTIQMEAVPAATHHRDAHGIGVQLGVLRALSEVASA